MVSPVVENEAVAAKKNVERQEAPAAANPVSAEAEQINQAEPSTDEGKEIVEGAPAGEELKSPEVLPPVAPAVDGASEPTNNAAQAAQDQQPPVVPEVEAAVKAETPLPQLEVQPLHMPQPEENSHEQPNAPQEQPQEPRYDQPQVQPIETQLQAVQPEVEVQHTAEAVAALPCPPVIDYSFPPSDQQAAFAPHNEPHYAHHVTYQGGEQYHHQQQHQPNDGGITVLLEGAAGSDAMDNNNAAADAVAGMASMPRLPPPVMPPLAPPHVPAMYPRNVGMPEVLIPAKWLARYEELKRYKEEHGHTNVPQKYEPNPQLGAWCRTQKQQMKLLQEGKPSHMSQGRLELLNQIGFEFTGEKRDKFWNDRYRELVEFHAKNNGSTRVPDKYEAAPQLNAWVALQRLQLKRYREGKKTKLTPERIALLEGLGLEHRIRNTCTWMERFVSPISFDTIFISTLVILCNQPLLLSCWLCVQLELKEFKEHHGNCNVPQKYKANPSLGRWVDNQKTQHKKLYEGKPTHLTIERIQLLVGLGFQWR